MWRRLLCSCLLVCLTGSLVADDDGHINDLHLGTWIHGHKVSKHELVGKVVCVVHWKVNGANIDKLPAIAKAFDDRPFHLIASHIGEHNTGHMVVHEDIVRDMMAYITQHDFPADADNFTVTRKSSHPDVIDAGPQRVGLPHAFIFDHTGRLVFQGSPSQIRPKVSALVKKVPAFYFGEFDYASEKIKTMAQKALKGKQLGKLLGELEKLTGGNTEPTLEDTEETMDGKDLMSRIRERFEEMTESAEEMIETEPARAVEMLEKVADTLKGSDFGKKARQTLDEFLDDATHQAALKLDRAFTTARRAWTKAKKEAEKVEIRASLEQAWEEALENAKHSDVAERVKAWLDETAPPETEPAN